MNMNYIVWRWVVYVNTSTHRLWYSLPNLADPFPKFRPCDYCKAKLPYLYIMFASYLTSPPPAGSGWQSGILGPQLQHPDLQAGRSTAPRLTRRPWTASACWWGSSRSGRQNCWHQPTSAAKLNELAFQYSKCWIICSVYEVIFSQPKWFANQLRF